MTAYDLTASEVVAILEVTRFVFDDPDAPTFADSTLEGLGSAAGKLAPPSLSLRYARRPAAIYPPPAPDDTPLAPDAQGFLRTPDELAGKV